MTRGLPRLPYGSWPSPISAASVAADRVRLADLQFDGHDLYWVEGRPSEQGRCVVVRYRHGSNEDVLPPPFSARTLVHEYGGGALRVVDGTVYFANAADKRLYAIRHGAPQPLTPGLGDVRYADMEVDRTRERVLCVVEDHRGEGVVNDIRAVPISGGEPLSLISGNDFYSNPRVSPDGSRLCWLTWNQPQMPWDGTELWLADLDAGGRPARARRVCGGAEESILQPEWSPEGVLHLVSDRSGWWNLYRVEGDDELQPVLEIAADCGEPAWTFRRATYTFLDGARIALCACDAGTWSAGIIDAAGAWQRLELPYNDIDGAISGGGGRIALIAGGPSLPHAVVVVDPDTVAQTVVRPGSAADIDAAVLSVARPMAFPGWGGGVAHGFYYEPRSDRAQGPADELPPLYVHAHGGPTSACGASLDPLVQFWTSRGFAFLDVNYGGSTGYGRAYRQRLNGQEGVVDVGDCVNGALHLAREGRVDGGRLVIEGGSAGGYIVLCAMTYHDVFAAGISLFGISDLELLVHDTHKFEARYFDSMIGPYPEQRDVYRARSPIHHIEKVRGAVFLLQGLDDPIVPANQAELMFEKLQQSGAPCAYVGFPGEQHGFRQASSIIRTLEGELYFLSRILGFDLPEPVEPVEVLNVSEG